MRCLFNFYLWWPSWRVCCQPSRRDWCQLISSSLLPAFQWVCCPVWRWLCYKSFYKMRFSNRLSIYNTLHALISVALFTMSRGHWLGQKRLKKPGQSGKGGHLGCSDGYNYNLYRPLSPIHINTEGREQMHAVLEKCANTLRFMSYENFMIWMSVFFSVRNLMSMGIVWTVNFNQPYITLRGFVDEDVHVIYYILFEKLILIHCYGK